MSEIRWFCMKCHFELAGADEHRRVLKKTEIKTIFNNFMGKSCKLILFFNFKPICIKSSQKWKIYDANYHMKFLMWFLYFLEGAFLNFFKLVFIFFNKILHFSLHFRIFGRLPRLIWIIVLKNQPRGDHRCWPLPKLKTSY